MSAIRRAIAVAIAGAVQSLNYGHKLAVQGRENEIADHIETAVRACSAVLSVLERRKNETVILA